jgi:hypothetical protein
LSSLQGIDITDVLARRTCADDQPRWFSFAGKTYLESMAENADKPQSERSEFHEVGIIGNGKPRKVCAGNYHDKTRRITGVWSGSGWAPFAAPAKQSEICPER